MNYNELELRLNVIGMRLAKLIKLYIGTVEACEEMDDESGKTVAENTTGEIDDDDLEFYNQTKYVDILTDSLIVNVSTLLESTFSEVIEFHLVNYSKGFKELSVQIKDLEVNSLEELISASRNQFVEDELKKLSFYRKFKYILDNLGIDMKPSQLGFERLLLIRDIRNLISHNNSKVNQSFVDRYGKEYGRLNDKVHLSKSDFTGMLWQSVLTHLIVEMWVTYKFEKPEYRNKKVFLIPERIIVGNIVEDALIDVVNLGAVLDKMGGIAISNQLTLIMLNLFGADDKFSRQIHIAHILGKCYENALNGIEEKFKIDGTHVNWLDEETAKFGCAPLVTVIKYVYDSILLDNYSVFQFAHLINAIPIQERFAPNGEAIIETYLKFLLAPLEVAD